VELALWQEGRKKLTSQKESVAGADTEPGLSQKSNQELTAKGLKLAAEQSASTSQDTNLDLLKRGRREQGLVQLQPVLEMPK